MSLDRFRSLFVHDEALGISLDVSGIPFADGFFASMEPRMQAAFDAMSALEAGAVANPDEGRRVGHYWLRAPALAPEPALRDAIERTLRDVLTFAARVHAGEVNPERAPRFEHLLLVGIGGSALGPQFVAAALGSPHDRLRPWFLDNTDPDGIDRTLAALGDGLARTLVLVVSKSGGTRETRNGMLEVQAAFDRAGLSFARHAVAVTGEGSELDRVARDAGFLARFPMWDWVGGRTSVTSAVGLLPAVLQGFDVEAFLAGAAAMDAWTRSRDTHGNPAAMLALAWFFATDGRGSKEMVVLPYKDRLELFSRYLQQLVMESLGKERDLDGRIVHQGLAVYGNKGSTDQHAYVQQLRDGLENVFVTFIEVLADRPAEHAAFEVEPGVTSGDYLFGFLHGTRQALAESGRASLTLTLSDVSARSVGALIALYERTVGLYARLIHVNAYHQPGVEAGKKAAGAVLALQRRVLDAVRARPGTALSLEEVARAAGSTDLPTVHAVLRHLAANPSRRLRRTLVAGGTALDARWLADA